MKTQALKPLTFLIAGSLGVVAAGVAVNKFMPVIDLRDGASWLEDDDVL